MALEQEASKAGGQVVPLLGNHEVMNILGDLRYVAPQSYAAFADGESEKRRKAAYDEYAEWAASHAKWLATIKKPVMATTEREWMAGHPAGFVEYREAFSANGRQVVAPTCGGGKSWRYDFSAWGNSVEPDVVDTRANQCPSARGD